MRTFQSVQEAASEIQRDLFKAPKVTSSRVQNLVGLHLPGREAFGYTYAILDGFPQRAQDVIELGQDLKMPLYLEHPKQMEIWLKMEANSRLGSTFANPIPPAEVYNPALTKVKEGDHWSYVYRERLDNWRDHMQKTLKAQPDSRRVFWPIYREIDAKRMAQPTRIPCSIGYQAMIREVNGVDRMLFFYLQRSCDYHNFWLSDIYFARRMQEAVAEKVPVTPGALIHFVISFHSFFAEGTEVY